MAPCAAVWHVSARIMNEVTMPEFDALLADMAEKVPLHGQGRALLGELVRFLTREPDGLYGTLSRLHDGGMEAEVASWLGQPLAGPLPTDVAVHVLSEPVVDGMATRLHMPAAAVAAAAGIALPRLVGLLTEGGTVPQGPVPAAVAFLHELEAPVAATPAPVMAPLRPIQERKRGAAWWLVPVLLAVPLCLGVYRCTQPGPIGTVATVPANIPVVPSAPPAPPVVAAAPAPLPLPSPVTPPRLSVSVNDADATVGGRVRDEATRASVLDALRRLFGADHVKGDIALDPTAYAPAWLGQFGSAIGGFKLSGLRALFDGNAVSVGGTIPDADRDRIMAALRSLFGAGTTVGPLADNVPDFMTGATRAALSRLSGLGGSYGARDVVGALNGTTIIFAQSSDEVQGESLVLLAQAAAKMKTLPASTVIEVAGYTDSTGDPVANQSLSQRRADAVRSRLVQAGVSPAMVTAKGFGAAAPVASNDTAEGRQQNRRIEYHVLSGG